MERSSPAMRFSNVDLPTLGRPIIATSITSGRFPLLFRLDHFHLRQRRIQQIVNPCAVFRRNGKHRHAQGMKAGDIRFLRARIHFVGGNHERLAGGAQQPRQLLVERRDARVRVDHQHQHRGVFNRHARLSQNFARDQRLVVRHHPAGVHNFQRTPAPFGFAIDAIAGDARLIGDDGAARPGEPVIKRGFAHIGAPHNYQRRQLLCHVLCHVLAMRPLRMRKAIG